VIWLTLAATSRGFWAKGDAVMTTVSGTASGLMVLASPANAEFCKTRKLAPASADVMISFLIMPTPDAVCSKNPTICPQGQASEFEGTAARRIFVHAVSSVSIWS
jgi:hypothetical protein